MFSLNVESEMFPMQDEELYKNFKNQLRELQLRMRLEGSRVSNRVLVDSELKLLEKGMDLAPIQIRIDESELRKT